jgi:hypothetical protein
VVLDNVAAAGIAAVEIVSESNPNLTGGHSNALTNRREKASMKTLFAKLGLASLAAFILPSCFGIGMIFDKRWREHDPAGYARQHQQARRWLVNDAKKHGYRIPPNE